MKMRWLPKRWELLLLPQALLLFLAVVGTFMFLFSVIMGIYQYNNHRKFLSALQTYGRQTEAVVHSIDRERGRGQIFLTIPTEEDEEINFAFITVLSLYPSDWLDSLAPGQPLTIVYVARRYGSNQLEAVPLAYYPQFQRSPGITPDIWGLFGFFLVVTTLKPHFLFLGMLKLEDILSSQLPPEFFPGVSIS